MGIDRGISCGTGQVLVLSVGDVEMGLWVSILLGQTEIDDIDLIASLADAHQEVVWFDVTVNEGFGVDVLDSRDELISQQEDGLEREFSVAEVEQIFQRGAEEIKYHGVVITFCAEPSHKRNTDTSCQRFVDAGLILELWVFGLDGF